MLLKSAENAGVCYSSSGMNNYSATAFLQKDFNTLSPDLKQEMRDAGREAYLASLFLQNADKTRYEKYQEECHNSFLQKDDKYPKTLADSYYRIDQYKYNTKIIQRAAGKTTATTEEIDTGHSFLSAGRRPPPTVPTGWKRNGNGKTKQSNDGTTGTRATGSTSLDVRSGTRAIDSTNGNRAIDSRKPKPTFAAKPTYADATKETQVKIVC